MTGIYLFQVVLTFLDCMLHSILPHALRVNRLTGSLRSNWPARLRAEPQWRSRSAPSDRTFWLVNDAYATIHVTATSLFTDDHQATCPVFLVFDFSAYRRNYFRLELLEYVTPNSGRFVDNCDVNIQ